MSLTSKLNISSLARFILSKVSSPKDFDSAYKMSLIFVEYEELNKLKLLACANFDEDELAAKYFDLCVYATRHAERILNSGLKLV